MKNDEETFNGHIFCIIGKSSSGKDTIAEKAFQKVREHGVNIRKIITYTTRPMRIGEKNGEQYFFVTDNTFDEMRDNGKLIEEREYDTHEGQWYYATARDGQIENNNIYMIIQTPIGIRKIEEEYGKKNITTIYITIDDGERLQRALNRERKQRTPMYSEMCRRFLSDEKDFKYIDEHKNDNIHKIRNYDPEKCSQKTADLIISILSSKQISTCKTNYQGT